MTQKTTYALPGSKSKWHVMWRDIKRSKNLYLFLIPAAAYYVIFRYMPMYYLQIAFKNFRITADISKATWAGLKYFEQLFAVSGFWSALNNTLIISLYKLIIAWPFPIILALLLNEMKSKRFKRVSQTLIYMPHFVSWVIVGGIIYNFTEINGGLFNKLLALAGYDPILFLGKPQYFRSILVISEIWKESGWGTIIFLAAMARIDPAIYESAMADGANRFRQIWHITLPGISDIIVTLLIVRLGNLLNVGFEQVLVLQNQMVLSVGDILDTFVYRQGLQEGRHSFAAAAGLFQSAIAAVMIMLSDYTAKRFGERGLL